MLGISEFVRTLIMRLGESFAGVKRARRVDVRHAMRSSVEEIEPRLLLSGDGLAATYFDNADLTGKSVSRVDKAINFDWGTGSPASGIGADTFSARYTGQVQAAKTETYTFYSSSDDGVRVWVDGKLIINDWSQHSSREDKGVISLVAGKRYNFKTEYFDQANGAVLKLSWSSASTAKQIVPQSQLYSSAASTGTPAPAPAPVPTPTTGSGNGLLGTYYDNADFTGKSITRTDKTVNFNWAAGSPATEIGADTFSARWTGQIQAQYTQEYTFYTQSDDGVRLWVNGVKLVDHWAVHTSAEDSGKIKLEAGKKYDIKIEYYEQSYGAVMQLKWASANTPKQVVAQSQLFSTTPVTPPEGQGPTPVPTPTPAPGVQVNGLLGTYYGRTDFSGNAVTRIDSNVQFDWGTSSPHEIIGSDGWSVRWVGQVLAPRTETYTFHVTSDDGARLWIDGRLIINDWAAHTKREISSAVSLQAGRKYDIKLEYYDQAGSAVAQLRWSSASIAKQFIPASNLFCTKPATSVIADIPAPAVNTGLKIYTKTQVNFRPGTATDKSLTLDGYRISNLPIDTKGMNIAVTDLQPGKPAWAYRNITIKNSEISDVYRTPGYHNDFIRIAGAAGHQDVPINVDLENIWIHNGEAIPVLITDGDYDTIVIRNVKITNCTVNQLQINTQNVGSVKRIIIENCPGLSVAIVGRTGTIGECIVRTSPGAAVSDSLNHQNTKSGVKITVTP